MLYVGVNLHKKSITVCGVKRERRVLESWRLFCGEEEGVVETFRTFRKVYGGIELVVEATASHEWFLQQVEPLVDRLRLGHHRPRSALNLPGELSAPKLECSSVIDGRGDDPVSRQRETGKTGAG